MCFCLPAKVGLWPECFLRTQPQTRSQHVSQPFRALGTEQQFEGELDPSE